MLLLERKEQMGYTHYWSVDREIPPDIWARIRNDTEKLVVAYGNNLSQLSIEPDLIVLNGEQDLSCETFWLTSKPEGFACCKTRHLPYDKLICAVLSVASGYTSAIQVSSDAQMGSVPDGWPAAARWATKVLGYKVRPPWTYSTKAHLRRIWHTTLRRMHLG
jgi:hypothetical protein